MPLYVFSYSGLLLFQHEELALNGQSVAWIDSSFSMEHIMTIDLFAEISNATGRPGAPARRNAPLERLATATHRRRRGGAFEQQ